jgi:hypothetical protein
VQSIRKSSELQSQYATLLDELAQSTNEFYTEQQELETIEGKCHAIQGLLSYHKGQVVEISPSRSEWNLVKGTTPTLFDL